jgi:RNA polymerase sigma-70 factor, ECF subfamily
MDHPDRQQAADLERFRGYLYVVARLHAGPRLQGKFDASDIVQQTLVQALDGLPQLKGRDDAETAAWLRQILARQLANVVRGLGRQKRDATREQSLENALDQSASRLEMFLAAADPSPSQQAQRSEQVLGLADALAALPEAQREAIVGHHLEGRTLAEVGGQMGRTPVAVAGLIKRGLRTLRLRLQDPDSGRTGAG